MFEASFTYIFSKSLMNTRTKKDKLKGLSFLLKAKSFVYHRLAIKLKRRFRRIVFFWWNDNNGLIFHHGKAVYIINSVGIVYHHCESIFDTPMRDEIQQRICCC